MPEPGFRPLAPTDLSRLARWLNEPHVLAWWREPLDLDAVVAKYGPRLEGRVPTHMFVIEHAGRPVGWIQWYRWADYPDHAAVLGVDPGSAGIDLAIGERDLLGRGIGSRALRAFVEGVIFAHPDVTACLSDPDAANARSLRAFEKAGFERVRTAPGSHGPVWVVRRVRG